MRRWHYLATLAVGAGLAVTSAMGCELIASVDRSLIPVIGGGQGGAGGGTGGAEPTTTGGGQGGAGGGQGGAGGVVMPTCDDGVQNGNETDVDCGGGTCGQCTQGQGCGAEGDCTTGFCFDAVCCDVACGATCTSCNLPGTVGSCTVVPAGEPDDACPAEPESSCSTTGLCDGAGSCALHPAGTVCAPATCTNGTFDSADTCDGGGTCTVSGTSSCGLYDCNAGGDACLTSCAMGSECAANAYCNMMMQCVAKKMNGATCQAADHCVSGYCVDGVCCNGACDGECERCNIVGSGGTCQAIPQGTVDPQCTAPTTTCNGMQMCSLPVGAACTMGSECASGTCTANVCAP